MNQYNPWSQWNQLAVELLSFPASAVAHSPKILPVSRGALNVHEPSLPYFRGTISNQNTTQPLATLTCLPAVPILPFLLFARETRPLRLHRKYLPQPHG
jgi:hypothetical protein